MESNEAQDPGNITLLLQQSSQGDPEAKQAILTLVYERLRAIAQKKMRNEPGQHTLQPTALVHEAFIRSLGDEASPENRHHFFWMAARAMHHILVEHARKKAALKRGGDHQQVDMDDFTGAIEPPSLDMLELQTALEKLEKEFSRAHEVVMLRYFAGLTAEDCADMMGVSLRTVEREWRFARVFLKNAMEGH